MKIIHVLNHFLPHQTAGTEVYVWALSKALKDEGHEVKVLIPNYGSFTSEDYRYDGISVHRYAEPSEVDRKLIMGFREPDGLSFFNVYLNKEKPDVVHFHELSGSNGIGVAHVRAAKKFGSKIIMTFHLAGYSCQTGTLMYKGTSLCDGKINGFRCGTCYLHKKGLGNISPLISITSNILYFAKIDPRKWNHSIGTALGTIHLIQNLDKKLRELIDLSDKVVCLTNWYQIVLQNNGLSSAKISYIPQGLPTAINVKVVERKQYGKLRLLFLGRISHFKGIHLLLEALSSFSQSEFELSIFGQGDGTDYEAKCRESTKDNANIHWKGNLPQERVYEEMSKHDLLCLCSTFSEMSPLVIQEARAAKLPILASNVIGNSEQIEHEINGILFDFNDVNSLRHQIKMILDNRLKLQVMRDNLQPFLSFRDIAQKYLMVYNSVPF